MDHSTFKEEAVERRLAEDGFRGVFAVTRAGVVTLSGGLPSTHQALEALEAAFGVGTCEAEEAAGHMDAAPAAGSLDGAEAAEPLSEEALAA